MEEKKDQRIILITLNLPHNRIFVERKFISKSIAAISKLNSLTQYNPLKNTRTDLTFSQSSVSLFPGSASHLERLLLALSLL